MNLKSLTINLLPFFLLLFQVDAFGEEPSHILPGTEKSLADFANSETLLTFSEDSTSVTVWEVSTGKKIRRIEGEFDTSEAGSSLHYSRDAMLYLSSEGGLSVWAFSDGHRRLHFRPEQTPARAFISPDGKLISFASSDQAGALKATNSRCHLVDVNKGIAVATLTNTGETHAKHNQFAIGSPMPFSPDSKLFVTAQAENLVLWELPAGKIKHVLKSHQSQVEAWRFAADGNVIASVEWEGLLCLWDTKSGKKLAQFSIPPRRPWELAFSADGKMLMAQSQGIAFVWDLPSKRMTEMLRAKKFDLFDPKLSPHYRLSPNGRYAFSVVQGSIHCWDLRKPNSPWIWNREGPDQTVFQIGPACQWVVQRTPDKPLKVSRIPPKFWELADE